MENKRQVQSLVSKSKSIVRLKPRNPEEKSSGPIMVQALCDFKQDQVRCIFTPTHMNRIEELNLAGIIQYDLRVSERYYERK